MGRLRIRADICGRRAGAGAGAGAGGLPVRVCAAPCASGPRAPGSASRGSAPGPGSVQRRASLQSSTHLRGGASGGRIDADVGATAAVRVLRSTLLI